MEGIRRKVKEFDARSKVKERTKERIELQEK